MSDFGPVQLRPALTCEARSMAEMSRDLVETGLGWRYTPIRMATLISDPDTVALVACDASHIQGFAVMRFGDEHAHLALLCVDAGRQRRGIASRLTKWLVKSAQVAGITSIELEVRADNLAALAFYRRLAFSETQWLPGYYSDRIAARRMVRTLRRDATPGHRCASRLASHPASCAPHRRGDAKKVDDWHYGLRASRW